MNDKFNAVPTRETNVKYSAVLRIVGMVTSVVVFGSAQAQENPAKNYPDKPIHVILGYAAGGANDLVARVFGSKLNEALGQPVLVESKTGAAGMIAVNYVAKTKPDGYTLLFAASSMFTTNPVMFRRGLFAKRFHADIDGRNVSVSADRECVAADSIAQGIGGAAQGQARRRQCQRRSGGPPTGIRTVQEPDWNQRGIHSLQVDHRVS